MSPTLVWEALDAESSGPDASAASPGHDHGWQPTGSEPPPADARLVRKSLVEERIQVVRQLVRDGNAGGALLGTRRGFSWLTAGGSAHVLMSTDEPVASVLVTPHRTVVLTANIEADRIAAEEIDGLDLELEAFDWFAEGGARAVADASVKGRLLVDADLEAELQPIRSVLAPLEQQRMTWLGARVQEALERSLDDVERDEPEDFLAADATMTLGEAGVRAPVVLVAADDRIERFRHPLPGRGCIQQRVMLVLVGERWGLHVAATAIRELESPSRELERRARAVERVMAEMVDATREGATLGSVFAAAQRTYKAVGFPDEWRLHHQGGSIGYGARERIAVPGDSTSIRAGMAFAWNPSITGAKVETTFILDEGGEARVLV